MHTPTTPATSPDRARLPAMLATLCSYESWLGPYHPQSLRLMIQVGAAYWQAGHPEHARAMLERAIANLGQHLGMNHDLRLSAMVALRDVFVARRDYERAAAVEKELLECRTARLGSDHPETIATRANLARIILETIDRNSNREV